jgi:hypothetical protein
VLGFGVSGGQHKAGPGWILAETVSTSFDAAAGLQNFIRSS